jgi:hypothetical protein
LPVSASMSGYPRKCFDFTKDSDALTVPGHDPDQWQVTLWQIPRSASEENLIEANVCVGDSPLEFQTDHTHGQGTTSGMTPGSPCSCCHARNRPDASLTKPVLPGSGNRDPCLRQ